VIFINAQLLLSSPTNGFLHSRRVELLALSLIVAGFTFIALFVMSAFREPVVRFLGGGIPLEHLGLPILGSAALVVLLVEVVNEGHVLGAPGIILGVLCILALSKKGGVTTTIIELIESSGIIFVAWLLLRGWRQTFADLSRFLSNLRYMYGAWVVAVALVAMVGFCVLMQALTQRKRARDQQDRMQNASYRKMQEEKWKCEEEKRKLERQLREIEDRQKHFVQHGMKW
jgi:hypothetical protein